MPTQNVIRWMFERERGVVERARIVGRPEACLESLQLCPVAALLAQEYKHAEIAQILEALTCLVLGEVDSYLEVFAETKGVRVRAV